MAELVVDGSGQYIVRSFDLNDFIVDVAGADPLLLTAGTALLLAAMNVLRMAGIASR